VHVVDEVGLGGLHPVRVHHDSVAPPTVKLIGPGDVLDIITHATRSSRVRWATVGGVEV
jgi:hypothetical protein